MMYKCNIGKWKIIIVMLAWCILGMVNVKIDEVKAETYGDYEYSLINDGTEVKITGYSGLDTDIVIPSEIDGKPVTCIGASAFWNCSGLTSIDLPEGLTTIGASAFSDCRGLTSIDLPEGLTTIGADAFNECRGLTSIDLPEGLTTIGAYAFSYCRGLTSIDLPDSLVTVEHWVFDETSISEINIGKALKIVDYWWLGSALDNIQSITLKESAADISGSDLQKFSKLVEIKVSEQNKNYMSEEGVLFSKDKTKLIYYPTNKEGTEYTVPNNVTDIEEKSFMNNTMLETINMTDNVKYIGNSAFSGAKMLAKINIPNGVTTIGEALFQGCTKLNDVVLSERIKAISTLAFENCAELNNVVLPDSLETIGNSAFSNCKSLKKITIGRGIKDINALQFEGTCLEEILVDEDNENYAIQDGALINKDKTKLVMYLAGNERETYSIPEGVKNIGVNAFSGAANLKEIVLPNTMEVVGDFAFKNCSMLESIVFPVKTSYIGRYVFSGCNNLKSITFLRFNGSYSEVPNNVIIKGYTNSAAQTMAEKKNLRFESLGEFKCEQHESNGFNNEYIPASCTKAGYRRYTCVLCGEQAEEEIPMLEHVWSEEYKYVEYPTCTSKGKEAIYCQNCGGVNEDTLREVDMVEHTEVKDEAVAATCTEKGKTEGIHCSVCGEVIKAQEEVAAIGHTEVKDEAIAATCTEKGKTEGSHCSVCGEVIKAQEEVAATGHGETEVRDAKVATETTDGYTGDIYCKSCGQKIKEGTVIKATGSNTTNNPSDDNKTPSDVKQENVTVKLPETGKVETDTKSNAVVKITNPGAVADGNIVDAEVEYTKPAESTAKVVIPDTVTVNGVTYKVTSISPNAFKNDKKIKQVTVGNNVTNIAKNTFANCTKLKSVTIGPDVTVINDKAFYHCSALTKITISKNVTKIGKSAFEGCKKLKTITIKSTKLASVGKNAFKRVSSNAKIKVPSSKVKAYKKLLKNKGQDKNVKITK